MAEKVLAEVLEERGLPYQRMEDEAAFYGPKIDFKVVDAIKRLWQLSTIQFDFNLPQRFNLEYIASDNKPQKFPDPVAATPATVTPIDLGTPLAPAAAPQR